MLIFCTSSPGLATKNLSIGIDWPAAGAAPQLVPLEFRRVAGTKTFQCPRESTERIGASLVTGLVDSVVYGPPQDACAGKQSGGAPTVPENTWFKTPFDQLVSVLFRTIHCCCEPLTTVPSNWESAMNPPLP